MVQYDRTILNKLLDTYESSLLSTGENRRNIHIEFPFTRKALPAYFDESSSEYERIHFFMEELAQKRLIQIIWKGKREGHIIAKVRLSTDRLEEAYAYLGRVPRRDMALRQRRLLEEYRGKYRNIGPVCRAFIGYLLERLEGHKSVKEFLDLEDPASTKLLLDAVRAIEENDSQLYIREFSVRHFQDSKAFERMEGRIAHVFRRFKENYEEAAYDEILAEYGIYHTPNYVYLKGCVPIYMRGEKINLAVFGQGLGISGEDIGGIRFGSGLGGGNNGRLGGGNNGRLGGGNNGRFDGEIDAGTNGRSDGKFDGEERVKQVITIENLTTYFRWQEEDSLLIYLGGYHNGVRRGLLREIYASFPEAVYCHFGDIDAGGFEIYRDLREEAGIPFRRYNMEQERLQRYEAYGKRLTENDRKRLLTMRERPELTQMIDYMLEHDVKLEQVCISNTPMTEKNSETI